MRDSYIHICGMAIITAGLVFTGFLYWAQPRSLAEVATKGQVATGTYSCSAASGTGWLVVTMGTKSTPQIPVQCG